MEALVNPSLAQNLLGIKVMAATPGTKNNFRFISLIFDPCHCKGIAKVYIKTRIGDTRARLYS